MADQDKPNPQGESLLGKPGGSLTSRATSLSSIPDSESEMERRKRGREKGGSPDKKKKKKSLEEDSDEDDGVEFGSDSLRNIDSGLDLLVQWSRQNTIQKMVTKPQMRKLERIIKVLREEVNKSREDRAKDEERSSIIEVVKKTVQEEIRKSKETEPMEGMSYSSVVGKKAGPKVPRITGMKGPVQPTPKLVIVRHDTKESEEVKASLKKIVKPSEIGLKVKRLTNIRNGVIVEAEDDQGADNLIKHEALQKAGFKVGKPAKKRPIVMIYDVSAEMKDEDIKEEVFTRNMQESGINEEDFKKDFEVKHRYKDARSSGKKCHIVVECSVDIRNWVRRKERLFIEWQSCRVKDYVDVARCYKCQKFGHVAKHCSSEKSGCSYCAGEHDYKDCPNKGSREKVCCINCKREGRPETKHDAGWRKCPAYEKAAKRQSDKIDYGS